MSLGLVRFRITLGLVLVLGVWLGLVFWVHLGLGLGFGLGPAKDSIALQYDTCKAMDNSWQWKADC